MRIFSFMNVLLLLVIMATHEGAHLDNLLSPTEARWLQAGAKVMMTGNIDLSTIKMIMKSAAEKAKVATDASPNAIAAQVQPQVAAQAFDFALEGKGGAAPPAGGTPTNVSLPPAASADIDNALAKVLASINS